MEPSNNAVFTINFSTLKINNQVSFFDYNNFRMLWGGEGYLYSASEDTTICVWNKSGQKM